MTKIKFAFLALLATFSFSAHAQFPDLKIKTSRVEGELYRCLQPGGGFALKTTEPRKIWQVDSKGNGEMSVDGLDLEITKFTVFRCAHCFTFEASLKMQKQELKYKGEMSANEDGINLEVTISGHAPGAEKKYSIPCKVRQ